MSKGVHEPRQKFPSFSVVGKISHPFGSRIGHTGIVVVGFLDSRRQIVQDTDRFDTPRKARTVLIDVVSDTHFPGRSSSGSLGSDRCPTNRTLGLVAAETILHAQFVKDVTTIFDSHTRIQ